MLIFLPVKTLTVFFATFPHRVGDSKRSKSAVFAILEALDFDVFLLFERAN